MDPRWGRHFGTQWALLLSNRDANALSGHQWLAEWIAGELNNGTGFDKILRRIVTAQGDLADQPAIVPYFADGQGIQLADLAGKLSRGLRGVQIQCAQCHDHKTEKWKTEDFRRLTACFVQTRGELVGREQNRRIIDVYDTERAGKGGPKVRAAMAEYAGATPGGLDGSDFSQSQVRRKALAEWMTAPQNPWFARAIVNRMWGHFLGRGVVDPIDDFRDSNPPILPELLDRLAADFTAHGHDLKRLMLLLVSTEAYQLAPGPRGDKAAEGRLWARFRMMPMGPDELLDSLIAATRIDAVLARGNQENLEQLKQQTRGHFYRLFEVDEEDESDDFEGTIPQALLLLNGRLTNVGSMAVPGSALHEILAAPGDDASKIRALYLRTLSREPDAAEVDRWKAFLEAPRDVVKAAPTPEAKGKKKDRDPLARLDRDRTVRRQPGPDERRRQAYEDLLWALVNSSEFYFNH
jgi:hypothetical protein